MVVTRTELSQIVDQVNKKFDELEARIKELEAKKQPVKKPASKAAPSLKPVAAALPPQTQTTAASKVAKTTMAQVAAAKSVVKPATRNVAPSRCDLRELQLQSLSTHHPAKREQRFFEWLSANGSGCSAAGLIKVKNQMAVWLGTAAGSKRINTTLNELLNPL